MAEFPNGTIDPIDAVDLQTTISADHANNIYAEVIAISDYLRGLMPACRAYRATSNQTINDNSLTVVAYNAEISDRAGEYDAASDYDYTASSYGIRSVVAKITFSAFTDLKYASLSIYKNGSEVSKITQWSKGTGQFCLMLCDHIYLEPNDTLQIQVKHGRGASADILYGEQFTSLSITTLS